MKKISNIEKIIDMLDDAKALIDEDETMTMESKENLKDAINAALDTADEVEDEEDDEDYDSDDEDSEEDL